MRATVCSVRRPPPSSSAFLLLLFAVVVLFVVASSPSSADLPTTRDDDDDDVFASAERAARPPTTKRGENRRRASSSPPLLDRIEAARLDLWSRGAHSFDDDDDSSDGRRTAECDAPRTDDDSCEARLLEVRATTLEARATEAPVRIGPVLDARRDVVASKDAAERRRRRRRGGGGTAEFHRDDDGTSSRLAFWGGGRLGELTTAFRGGGGGGVGNVDEEASEDPDASLEARLSELSERHGDGFREAIERNKAEHASDCAESCEYFYCADPSSSDDDDGVADDDLDGTTSSSFDSYSFGAVPPEDFAANFGFPLDLIKVSRGEPLFPASEAREVVRIAEEEGVDMNEYESGKYKLGGDWLTNLPRTRAWFNRRLRTTFFPLLRRLFPEIVSSTSVLRAHSVSLLKYNVTHPRTDVHVDNGILAMTLAMTPSEEYVGGGTFFEHMGLENVVPMDVGHGTFRPGSVRHGGHRVTSGTRYILGAFLLLEDRVEHVRRLKNRGSELRRAGNLDEAERHFEWALEINPKCTTCLKDWAEILHARKQYAAAERKIRSALSLLEDRDSDALFTLGLLLSEQGRDDESVDAYRRSLDLNDEDAELCYNLGVKLGARGDVKGEMGMYAKATRIDPKFGGAWVNWGTALAEGGNLDDAEIMFQKALECCPEVETKAMMNLALVHHARAERLLHGGDVEAAKVAVSEASRLLDDAKPLLNELLEANGEDDDAKLFLSKFKPLRLRCHKLLGQAHAAVRDFESCESEFRSAVKNFEGEASAWDMLARILDLRGKVDEAREARERATSLL